MWTGTGDARGSLPSKLFYKENGTAVPDDLVAKLMKQSNSEGGDGQLETLFTFEVVAPEDIIREFNDTYTNPNGTNKYGSE